MCTLHMFFLSFNIVYESVRKEQNTMNNICEDVNTHFDIAKIRILTAMKMNKSREKTSLRDHRFDGVGMYYRL